MRMLLPRALALVLLVAPLPLHAQGGGASPRPLARADSLFEAGERERAKVAYQAVIAADPQSSRALYQLARLEPRGSARAVSLLRRYVALEPEDAWGHGALARALVDAGEPRASLAAYDAALVLEPGEREFVLGRARALARSGRTGAAAGEYQRWLDRNPDDAEALRELADDLRQARRPRAAARALERSLRLEENEVAAGRLRALRMETAPAVRPQLRGSRDSDGNTVLTTRLEADASVAEGLRVGVLGGRVESGDGVAASTAWEGGVRLGWQPSRSAMVDALGGVAVLPSAAAGSAGEALPLVRLRARWRPESGPSAEVRVQHEPVTATPLLLGTPVVLGEARGVVDLPLLGPLHARALGRAGRLEAAGETNTRVGFGGGGVVRLGGASEVGAVYQRTGYAAPSAAGYFAPERIESVEVGAYTEYYGAWPLTIALDAGAGGERIADWGGVVGGWEPAFRLWSQLSWSLSPGRELRLEAEAYETRAGAAIAPTADGWRWGSLGLSFHTAIR